MPDNVTIDGQVYATNLISDVHYPRIKAGWGAAGAYNDVSAASPLPTAQQGPIDVEVISSIALGPQLDYAFIVVGETTIEVPVTTVAFSRTSNGIIVAAPGVDSALWVLGYFLQASAAQASCQLLDGSGGAVKHYHHPGANGGVQREPVSWPRSKLSENTALYLSASFSSGSVSGDVTVATVPV